uniref:Uncharacterized protein n=1 Tax=Chromera velia CCMP2878 TaxID=1169474 RepID=A0A0G4FSJ6_9ALVE|eukprot:Cvel_18539.t1-p1 / transcript=Cvel_18539.t1 / gene=Cvel_18539 / organism=Chromera_velia_CCMP2878 / gene_product=hypothetical protein / transcript_product=hypothetical protein / location=Cvel_scaffold1543:1179-2561(+) / protein_length=461 / sequence_SO=supercontig / SO=protein_coding / is_pseudo=false
MSNLCFRKALWVSGLSCYFAFCTFLGTYIVLRSSSFVLTPPPSLPPVAAFDAAPANLSGVVDGPPAGSEAPAAGLVQDLPIPDASLWESDVSVWECREAFSGSGTKTCRFRNVCFLPKNGTIYLDTRKSLPARNATSLGKGTASLNFETRDLSSTGWGWLHSPVIWLHRYFADHPGHTLADDVFAAYRVIRTWQLSAIHSFIVCETAGRWSSHFAAVSSVPPVSEEALVNRYGEVVCAEELVIPSLDMRFAAVEADQATKSPEFADEIVKEMADFRANALNILGIAERPIPRTGRLRVLIVQKGGSSSHKHIIGNIEEAKDAMLAAFPGLQVTVTSLERPFREQVLALSEADVAIMRGGSETVAGLFIHPRAQFVYLTRGEDCKHPGDCGSDWRLWFKYRKDSAECFGNGPEADNWLDVACYPQDEEANASILQLDPGKLIQKIEKAITRMHSEGFKSRSF